MYRRSFMTSWRSMGRAGAVLAVLAAAGLSASQSMAAASNLLINATANTNNVNGTIGFAFAAATFPTAPTIKGLGFIDAGENGLAASHQVGLYHWNGSAYTLQRSVTIGSGTAFFLDGGYRWYPIADYTLSDPNPSAYFIAATVSSGDGDSWGGNGSADLTNVGNNDLNAGYNTTAGSQSSSLLPSTWNGSFPGNTFYNAPNATLNAVPVPEPSTYALTLAGAAYGGFSMWRRRKRA
jgi:hypothetical protein